MENLTKSQDIVRELGEPRSVPGFSLVVYREQRENRTSYRVVGSDEVFRPKLFDRFRYGFVAFAVSEDEALDYRFGQQVLSQGLGKADHYSLEVAVRFRVKEPEVVVAKLPSDPLRRLRREIELVLEQTAATISHESVLDPKKSLERALLGSKRFGSENETNFDHLQRFARELGFHLMNITIGHHLPTGFVEAAKTEVEEERKRKRKAAEHKTVQLEARHEVDLALLNAQGQSAVRQVQRATDFFDRAEEQLVEALKHIAANTDSARALKETLREFIGLRREFQELNAGPLPSANGTDGQHWQVPLKGSERGRLTATDQEGGALLEEIGEMRTALAGLDCRPSELRALTARIVHLLAELSLEDESDPEALDRYSEDLGEYCLSIRLTDRMTRIEQREYLQKLQNIENMKAVFSCEDVDTTVEVEVD